MGSFDTESLRRSGNSSRLLASSCQYTNTCMDSSAGTDGQFGEQYKNPLDTPAIKAVFITLYCTVFVMAFVGNLLVVLVVLKNRRMRTITNFFLANLAVADLAVAIFCVLPNLSHNLFLTWHLGRVMCKLYYFVQAMSYTASVTILTAISIERFFAIIYPLKSKHLTTLGLLRAVVLIVWLLSAASGVPYLVVYDQIAIPSASSNVSDSIQYFCVPLQQLNMKAYVTCNFIIWYLLPLLLMSIMYTKISMVLWKSSKQTNLNAMSSPCRTTATNAGSSKSRLLSKLPQGQGRLMHSLHNNSRRSSTLEIRGREYPASNSKCLSVTQTDTANMEELQRVDLRNSLRPSSVSEHLQDVPGPSEAKKPTVIRAKRVDNALTQRRQVIRLLIAVILTFALCVLPYHMRVLWQTWSEPHLSSWQTLLPPITFVISYLNCGLNPLLYAFFSDKFRKSLFEIFPRCIRQSKRQGTSNYAMRTLP